MKIHTVGDWGDYARLTGGFSPGGWLFRGVRDSAFELIPQVGRRRSMLEMFEKLFLHPDSARKEREKKTREAEIAALRDFKRAGLPHLRFKPETDLQWLAVAQHHGLPTRLLDWTESPFIAAYFAVRGPPLHYTDYDFPDSSRTEVAMGTGKTPGYKPGAVYVAKAPEQFPSEFEDDLFRDSEVVFLYAPPHLSPRVIVQKAMLTFHGSPTTPWEQGGYMKIEIPGEIFFEFRKVLDMVGFNEASLFPDLDGISRHIGMANNLSPFS